MHHSKVTLKDIARETGISVNSVSCALKDKKNISAKTRKYVKEVASRLGYVPDLHAQSLRSKTFDVIAIVYDNLNNPYYSIMVDLIHSSFEEKDIESLIFIDHHALGHLSLETARQILSYRVTGVLSFLSPTEEALKLLENNNIPLVLLGRNGAKLGISSVYTNDYEGGKLAAKAFLNQGSKKLLYLTKHHELEISKMRLEGFKDEILNAGYKFDDSSMIIGSFAHSAENELKDKLNKEKIDGIFCFSDIIAFEVVQFLYELGYKVPEDISVIGYDNLQDGLPYPIKISSIDSNKTKIVEEAISLLLKKMKSEDYPKAESIEFETIYKRGNTTLK